MGAAEFRDMTGRVFGRLTVTGPSECVAKRWYAPVRCECGVAKRVNAYVLAAGITRSCGCLLREPRPERRGRRRTIDRVGQVFGRLTVLEHLSHGAHGTVRCRCVCGAEHVARTANVVRGISKSCGCLRREVLVANFRTHGLSGHPLYSTWVLMNARCDDPTVKHFRRYGGRGIRVCERWRTDLDAFVQDMGAKPSPAHSIDRIDNDGNYSCGHCDECRANGWPANCRWATAAEQMRNTSRNVYVEIGGKRENVSDVCRRHGISRQLMHMRVSRWGWTIERACTTPPNPRMGSGGFRRHTQGIRRLIAAAGHATLRASASARKRLTDYAPRAANDQAAAGVACARAPRKRGRKAHYFVVGAFELTLAEWSLLTGVDPVALRARFKRGVSAAQLFAPVARRNQEAA